MLEDFLASLFGLVVFLAFIAALIAGVNALNRYSCENIWADSGFPSKYKFLAGCQIQVKGKWVPSKSYRNVAE